MKLEFNKGWALLVNDDNTPVTNVSWSECYGLAKVLSVRYGKRIEMIPVREAERLYGCDRKFRELLTNYWIHNKEIMKSCKNNDELRKRLKLKTKYVYQWSSENGLSSVRSPWPSVEGCFTADALWPSHRDDGGVAAFALLPKRSIKRRLTGKCNKINMKI